ncbi:amidinotransferase [Fulvivirga sp. M361]|uniref:dimethylarginine dimethylaminohydrolase family protein n=1 Tax=Fulvivirga sp. M361 TaxID=2594266 RepID=UPI001179E4DE|nr:arginine deiminase family protein [Fulvivirga sp. M361]TRX47137.1 amidinotransferase [Fulvivirga sp. M361]
MLNISVKDETSRLRTVVLGTAESFGGIPALEEAYDPKSKQHIQADTYPKEDDLIDEMNKVVDLLKHYDVEVFRPEIITNYNQVFARDIGFVIDQTFVRPQILENRHEEINGIRYLVEKINPDQILEASDGVRMEGGDVMPWNDYLFVGYSESTDFNKYLVSRTNEKGVDFLRTHFPHRKVKAFELKKSDDNPYENALHLDCCFQPVGLDQAIIYKGGFKNVADYEFLVNYFGKDKIIEITKEEMYDMNSNVFSISPEVVISEQSFSRLNGLLKDRGFKVETVKYSETSKMEGLLRCTTLPLLRD